MTKTKTVIPVELSKLYFKFRKYSPFTLVGHNARLALESARTLLEFQQLESDGLVRMRCEPESENYFDVFGTEDDPKLQKQMEEIIERLGCWWTASEWFDGDEWQHSDSCGMHTGYNNPASPFENCYVIDEMQSAIDALHAHQESVASERNESHRAACMDIETVNA